VIIILDLLATDPAKGDAAHVAADLVALVHTLLDDCVFTLGALLGALRGRKVQGASNLQYTFGTHPCLPSSHQQLDIRTTAQTLHTAYPEAAGATAQSAECKLNC
jgi:hypothetical protein